MTSSGEPGTELNLVEIIATLADRMRWTPEQIGDLDRWWIAHIYFAARDPKTGIIKRQTRPSPPPPSPREQLIEHYRPLGLPGWFADMRLRRIGEEKAAKRAAAQAAAKAKAAAKKTTRKARRRAKR